jgi:hypothetical protein
VVGSFEQGDESFGSMKCRDILDWLRAYQVVKVSAAWNLGGTALLKVLSLSSILFTKASQLYSLQGHKAFTAQRPDRV